MRRIRMLAALTAVSALSVAGIATAATTSATTTPTSLAGGTSTLTLSATAQSAISGHSLTIAALTPAAASGATYTFPINHGRVNLSNLHGKAQLIGGFTVSNGTRTLTVRHLHVISDKSGAWVYGSAPGVTTRTCTVLAGHHHSVRTCVVTTKINTQRIAQLKNPTQVSGTSVTATVALTDYSARVLDKLAGTTTWSAGSQLGTMEFSAPAAS